MVYYPRRPECFLLSEEDKKNYREECNIADSNTKMLALMRNFKLFSIQMEGNIRTYRTQRLIYFLGSKDAFAVYNIFCWFFSCIINYLVAIYLIRGDDGGAR